MFRPSFISIRSSVFRSVFAALFSIAASAWVQAADNRAPEVPTDIQVPEGHKVLFHGYAEGVQIYTWNGASWGSSIPEAVLVDQDGELVAIHYGGPTWESNSGGLVMGTVVRPRVTVDPDAIPWLLLAPTQIEGAGIFSGTTYIQRVNTVGGKAPAAAGAFVGEVARVPYAADYYFYRSATN
jgi:hypothetical protein